MKAITQDGVNKMARPEIPEESHKAANTPEKKHELTPEMVEAQWKPGQSGNPSGRPKKKPITEMYERLLADPKNIEAIEAAVAKALSKGQMAMVLQLKEMTDRVEGKVSQPVEVEGSLAIHTLSERMIKARERAGSGS